MQSLIQALTAAILADGQISGLLAQNQVFAGAAPETALMPFLTLATALGGATRHDFAGNRVTETVVLLTAVGESLPVLLEIADQLASLLDAASFPLSAGVLLGIWQERAAEPAQVGFDAANDEVYRVQVRFRCQVFEWASHG